MQTLTLHDHLHRFARRLLAIGIATGVGWGLAAALLFFLGGAWLDLLWELPPALRLGWGMAAMAVGACLIAVVVQRAMIRCRPAHLARQLDQVSETHGQIRTGVDLLEQRSASPLTAGLADLAVKRARELADKVPGARAIPARPAAWALGGLAALLVGIGLLALALPRLAHNQWLRFSDPFGDHPPFSRVIYHVEPGNVEVHYGSGLDIRMSTEGAAVDRLQLVWETATGAETLPLFAEPDGGWRVTLANVTAGGRYFVKSPAGRSPRFRIDVLTVPRLEAVRFRVTPPVYANRPAYEGPLPQGGLTVLPGTQVQVWAQSNRPLGGGTVEVPGAGAVSLQPLGPDSPQVTGSFTVQRPGKMQLQIQDVAGQRSTESFIAPIQLLPDERPLVRILEPPPVSLATPTVTLPVSLAAEDDFGIGRLELYRSLNDSTPLPLALSAPSPAPTRWTTTVLLPFAEYGLEPGDEIKLFARVEDNDPAGAKGSESAVIVIRVIAQADFEKMVRARQGVELLRSKYQQARRRLESMANDTERLRKKNRQKPAADKTTAEDRDELQQLARQMRQEAEAIRKAASKPLDLDLDRHLTPHLERLSRQLEQAAKDLEGLAGKPGLTSEELAKALEAMGQTLDRESGELQREALEPLETLAAVYPLLEAAARFVALYQRQKGLAERLQSLKDLKWTEDPKLRTRMRDLQDEQERLRAALAKLLDDLEDHAARLPEDKELDELRQSVREFVQDVRASGAAGAMSDAEAGLAEFSGVRAAAAAQKAAEILEQFIDRSQGMKGMMGLGMRYLRFKPSLKEGLGETIAQLLGEAGLPSQGNSTGNGSSMQQNTLDNVGLYGGLPSLGENENGEASGRAGATGNRAADNGMSRGPTANAGPGPGAAGGSDAAVPAAYRRRVAEYFQRVVEETGK